MRFQENPFFLDVYLKSQLSRKVFMPTCACVGVASALAFLAKMFNEISDSHFASHLLHRNTESSLEGKDNVHQNISNPEDAVCKIKGQ